MATEELAITLSLKGSSFNKSKNNNESGRNLLGLKKEVDVVEEV